MAERLERDPSFLLLWAGQAVSEVGSGVTLLALPTAAIFLFHAGPVQVGLLSALDVLPFIGLPLLFGPLADRMRRRPVLIAADLTRFALLASIPAAALVGRLTLAQLFLVALLAGIGDVAFQVAYQAHLPQLVGRDRLVGANTRLYVSAQTAGTLGPMLSGALVQLVGAAQAIAVDAFSYLVSAASIALIPRPEPPPAHGAGAPSFGAQLAEGVRFVFQHRVLRRVAAGNAAFTLGYRVIEGLLVLYAYRVLHLTPIAVGVVFAVSTGGTVAGALLQPAAFRVLGFGRALIVGQSLMCVSTLFVPLASIGPALPCLLAFGAVGGLAAGVFDSGQLSLRQLLTPEPLQARMNATMRTLFWGPRPLVFLAAGFLGATLGLAPALWIGAVLSFGSVAFWAMPDLWVMRRPPALAD